MRNEDIHASEIQPEFIQSTYVYISTYVNSRAIKIYWLHCGDVCIIIICINLKVVNTLHPFSREMVLPSVSPFLIGTALRLSEEFIKVTHRQNYFLSSWRS